MNFKRLITGIQPRLRHHNKRRVDDGVEPSVPVELFNSEQMKRHAVALALSHKLAKKSGKDILRLRLSESESTLTESCALLTANTIDGFMPAREWLLDNLYLIQEQIYCTKQHLPKEYGRSLPQLTGGILGYPRVYNIAVEIIEHGDGRWDLENLSNFIMSYQSVTPLTLGELWAIPITLRIALIESLGRASTRIVADINHRNLASEWANRIVEVAVHEPKQLVMLIAEMAKSDPQMNSAFIAELVRRLQGAALSLPLSWIEQRLAEDNLTVDQLVQEENQHQAAEQLTVSNCIASLRRLASVDWRDFVEMMSIVEHKLKQDPVDAYAKMDFSTRDRYRHVVEHLAQTSTRSEQEVAECAIGLAKTKAESNSPDEREDAIKARCCHVGYYLIDAGIAQLQQALGVRRSPWQTLCHFMSQHALMSYLGSILLITSAWVTSILHYVNERDLGTEWVWVLGIVIALYGSQIAIALVNLGVTLFVKPRLLPRMDLTKGIPAAWRTLVVIPAMLRSESNIKSLCEKLEVRFLGNRDPNLHFMLLTDFNDAASEHMPTDDALLTSAREQIVALNSTYPGKDSDTFFLCHRSRQWNDSEGVWMGKERKRGKLMDLNHLLRGKGLSHFSVIEGRIEVLKEVKYVITLDVDTQLPRESARQFIGTMVHPLNRPCVDEAKQRVIKGYGILQPRVGEILPLSGPTRYVRIWGNEFGIDPYTRSVSDVYQDLFHEGSFIGKGIYDVDIVQQVLEDRFPENRILSHDLLEGCYMHSGFLSDVPVYEKSPGSYLSDVKRRTRWIRGDWQIAAWIFPWVKNGAGHTEKNTLSALSRFKLFDNLRRSLVPVSLLILLGLSLMLLPESFFWFGVVLVMVVLPAAVNILLELLRKPHDMQYSQHVVSMTHIVTRYAQQLIFYVACLPHEAWYSIGAILRTCWRMMVSKKHLLEWTPSEEVTVRFRDTPWKWFTNMWMGPALSVAAFAVLVKIGRFESLLCATPLLLLWFTSPLIARWLSRPIYSKEPKLKATQVRFLHKMARKTWGFFETFVTAADNWLPPDNYQEVPVAVLARRTSPTNIGISLLANLTAYDFGYLNMHQLLERTSNTVKTLNSLERYRGHLYNWYSTETLSPLLPRYVSTVDSGNFVGHILTLRQGLLALPDEPLLSSRYLDGLEDTYDILSTEVIQSKPAELTHFHELLQLARSSCLSWKEALSFSTKIVTSAERICAMLQHIVAAECEFSSWSNKLLVQCQTLRDEVALFAEIPGLTANVTLRQVAGMQDDNCKFAKERMVLIDKLSAELVSLAQIDFSFLYDEASHLMTIGFNVDTQLIDASSYDLLSSEARLGNFVAIAQGQLMQESWFSLGRLLISSGGESILISWSGSMFEYLMPLLVMPTYPRTLLDQTYSAVVRRQIAYGKQQGVPWGVSESGYNAVDMEFNYLYRAFGVPGLGLKRGLEDDLVISPYASALALMVAPQEACLNLQRLAKEYAVGPFGFYEAIDFTKSRLPGDAKRVLVRSFMTHHQGMSLLAFSYLLHNQPMQKRFIAEPIFQATLLLLQERIPKPVATYLQVPHSQEGNAVANRTEATMRVFNYPDTHTPQVQLLSNGRYHLVMTQAGGGYSRYKDIALTRWREDSTCDGWGMFGYVRDVATGQFWSTTYQPTLGDVENFKTVFSEAHAEFVRSDHQLNLHTEVLVSPETDVELRRVRMHNRSKIRRTIEFTSYAEVVMAPQAADLSQPAFNNLFVQTELLPEFKAILATRRPEDTDLTSPWLFHLLNTYSKHPVTLSFETDRVRFVGRGRNLEAPLAMVEGGDLSNTQGAVLDPVIAIRCRVTLDPDALVIFDLLTGVAESRPQCVALVEKFQDKYLANRIFGLAWTHGRALLHHLNISEADAQLYGRLASAIIYSSNTRRAEPDVLASNRRGQSGLWGYSISGDLPIVLVHIEDSATIELAHQLIQAQAYWRNKGLLVDLVILNEETTSYRQILQDALMGMITGNNVSDHSGTIVVRAGHELSEEDHILLQSVARVILWSKRGTLKEQLTHRRVRPPLIPLLNAKRTTRHTAVEELAPIPKDLQFFNGIGGFSADCNEYIIRLSEGVSTPAPWINVLANPNFGTLVSESGQGYTWVENAHEFRLTPWDNDPLKDTAGEAYYLRDEETGHFWSPAALPCRGRGDYQIRHGFGYSVFEHVEDGIHTELWIYVALDAAVKFAVLKIRNDSLRPRQLSATGYVEWVLGDLRTKNAMYVVTQLSPSGVLLAQNHYNTDFGDRAAFFDAATTHLGLTSRTVSGDRTEFLGRNGGQNQPKALKRKHLSGRVGAGIDPCGVIQLAFDLAEGQSREIVFTLGAGQNKEDALSVAQRYHGRTAGEAALADIQNYWKQTLSKVQIRTPDAAVNLMANGWLIYQVLSSRLWGRTGYYQSSGAFGFRDQLQDVMSLPHVAPELFRAQLLLCAAHQFEEGDVQHWWHPPLGRGVRTRCSDDYLWLPFALCRYIETTGDMAILDETVPFLQGRPLKEDEQSYYELPTVGNESASLYQHALRAINNGLKFGEHGLPLMGSGDWNDGMNLVGKDGKGESVWLAFFLYSVLERFALLATRYGDNAFAARCQEESKKLQQQIEAHAWDGKWYRRAYFDDGQVLGSSDNIECKIDSIAQSWSVLSGAADADRAQAAMAAVNQLLVSESDKLVKLLTPPFDKSKPNPGYIQGYVAGIRENGGQYTHGAIWTVMAFAQLGEKELAWKLLDLLNPINHGLDSQSVALYKIEPYVLAGDVYSVAPHTGHGGWSWYTGSAGWMYRLITETLLGLNLVEGNQLRVTPLLPDGWDGFSFDYTYGDTVYHIKVSTGQGKTGIQLNEVALDGTIISLCDDGRNHQVVIYVS